MDTQKQTIQYYGVAARGPKREIAEVLVSVVPGRKSSQEWTGVVYRSQREANEAMVRKNTGGAS